jgi:integrase/recombinase XerD
LVEGGLSHLQLESPLLTSRDWINQCDFALVRLLGLMGLRIFESCGLSISDLGEECSDQTGYPA